MRTKVPPGQERTYLRAEVYACTSRSWPIRLRVGPTVYELRDGEARELATQLVDALTEVADRGAR